ncbi:MAG TPA: hypothetical protein PLO23_03955 [Alphaproteobacteria bacterium]|nr:hypothetical protein [Alphaproteobacteria bacterium]
MIYIMGSIGFLGGFGVGQMVLYFLLRHKTKDELLTDPALKKYGLLNWAFAVLGAWLVVQSYLIAFVN